MAKYRIRRLKLESNHQEYHKLMSKMGFEKDNQTWEYILERYEPRFEPDNDRWVFMFNCYAKMEHEDVAVTTLKEQLNLFLDNDIVEVFDR